MMGDRNFASHAVAEWLDPMGVILFSMIAIAVLGTVSLFYLAHQSVLEREAFEKVCVDAGGYPVETHIYIKGSKDGHLCINPSAIIQLKDK